MAEIRDRKDAKSAERSTPDKLSFFERAKLLFYRESPTAVARGAGVNLLEGRKPHASSNGN